MDASRSPNPQAVFDDPDTYLGFILSKQDEDFEGQHFDRKLAGPPPGAPGDLKKHLGKLREQVTETVSAFTNSNDYGGLLVLGVDSSGTPHGLGHLSEDQCNSLLNLGNLLRGHLARARLYELTLEDGSTHLIGLVYAAYNAHALCETTERQPRLWIRAGRQNTPVDDQARDSLKRQKRLTDYEIARCGPVTVEDIDAAVMGEFRRSSTSGVSSDSPDVTVLRAVGAIDGTSGDEYFTNAGYLFFTRNPQRRLPSRSIRLLRLPVKLRDAAPGVTPDFDKEFVGSPSQQIRQIRAFLLESGFFKTFQVRRPAGGFDQVPEYPPIALDEAIVNAVAHRDYAVTEPITCIAYRDGFVVRNPGRLRQRNQTIPDSFSLDTVRLESNRNNPLLLEWLSRMRDDNGSPYVRLLSEGTARMESEMASAGLPAPEYKVSPAQTEVLLSNDLERRESEYSGASTVERPSEFTNLYALRALTAAGAPADPGVLSRQRSEFIALLADALKANGWHIDRFRKGRLDAHRRGHEAQVSDSVRRWIRFYPGYAFRFRDYRTGSYLCIDYEVQVKNVASLDLLLQVFNADRLVPIRCVARTEEGRWLSGRVIAIGSEASTVEVDDIHEPQQFVNTELIPSLPMRLLHELSEAKCPGFSLHRTVKQHSLSAQAGAARERAERSTAIALSLSESVFPIQLGSHIVSLDSDPACLQRRSSASEPLSLMVLDEPEVVFGDNRRTQNIREGITQYGAYAHDPQEIELVPVCAESSRGQMEALIDRLQRGKYKYRGSERTFGVRFKYHSVVTVGDLSNAASECERLLESHSEWQGDASYPRLFLVQTPEAGFALDDESSPYYAIKRRLLAAGIPCQMIDTPTLTNPDWKDLNLALNVAAKCGRSPWVLPNALPDADLFVGLSYTSAKRGPDGRFMGYASVFNSFGRWEFYSASAEAFSFDQRVDHMKQLIEQTLSQAQLPDKPHIHFHYTKKFSRDERDALLQTARRLLPNATFTFVWINIGHGVRLYDSRPETDGSLARGGVVNGGRNQVLVSTTGFNPYRKAMGTPIALEVNARAEYPVGVRGHAPDMKAIASHVLSLTKLNWASTDSLCGEPITTKYAGDIAYLTSAFLRQGGTLEIHPVLQRTPWFI